MNKAYIWTGIGIMVILVGGYVAFGRAGGISAQTAATSTSPATLRELAMSGTPQKCTFTSANGATGTVYVAGGKTRSDFSTTAGGKVMSGHALVLDNTSYVWIEGASQGYKNSFDAAATSTATVQTGTQGVSPDEHASYDCQAWSPDDATFALPASVTFMSVSDIQAKAGGGALGASCGQCDAIPNANTKAQCKAALHC